MNMKYQVSLYLLFKDSVSLGVKYVRTYYTMNMVNFTATYHLIKQVFIHRALLRMNFQSMNRLQRSIGYKEDFMRVCNDFLAN